LILTKDARMEPKKQKREEMKRMWLKDDDGTRG
jgi:hypothetical protein